MSLRAAPHQHGLVELLRWAARSRDDRLSRETCEFAARLLDSEPVPLARQPSLGFSEAAVSELDLCPSCESEVLGLLNMFAANERFIRREMPGSRARYERMLRSELGLSRPAEAAILAAMLEDPGELCLNSNDPMRQAVTKVNITRLRQQLASLGIEDAIITARRNRAIGHPGGYALKVSSLASLQALVSFDLAVFRSA